MSEETRKRETHSGPKAYDLMTMEDLLRDHNVRCVSEDLAIVQRVDSGALFVFNATTTKMEEFPPPEGLITAFGLSYRKGHAYEVLAIKNPSGIDVADTTSSFTALTLSSGSTKWKNSRLVIKDELGSNQWNQVVGDGVQCQYEYMVHFPLGNSMKSCFTGFLSVDTLSQTGEIIGLPPSFLAGSTSKSQQQGCGIVEGKLHMWQKTGSDSTVSIVTWELQIVGQHRAWILKNEMVVSDSSRFAIVSFEKNSGHAFLAVRGTNLVSYDGLAQRVKWVSYLPMSVGNSGEKKRLKTVAYTKEGWPIYWPPPTF